MNTTTNNQGATALALVSIATEGLAWAVRAVVAPGLALLLTVCGYRPTRPAQKAVKTAQPAPAPSRSLEALTVAQLRQLARAAGHRALARSGRRAELLLALA